MEHAWCSDPSRDERVRAAEDGREGAFPTLAEAIDGMFPKSVWASSAVEAENKGGGMRTERVTLEVTHDLDARLSDWIVEVVDESLGMMESVRVVEGPKLAPDANANGQSNHAASGGEQDQEPVAWGATRDSGSIADAGTSRREMEHVSGMMGGTVVPLYRSPPQPRGWLSAEERDAIKRVAFELEGSAIAARPLWVTAADAATIRALLSRVTETEPRGWLTGEEREAVETARDHFDNDDLGDSECVFIARMMKQILARSTPPEVVKPGPQVRYHSMSVEDQRDAQWLAALAAAGVAVKEGP